MQVNHHFPFSILLVIATFFCFNVFSCQPAKEEKTIVPDSDTIVRPAGPAVVDTVTEKLFLDTTWNGKKIHITWRNAAPGKTDSISVQYDGASSIAWAVPEVDNIAEQEQRRLLVYQNGKTTQTAFVSLGTQAFLVSASTEGMNRPGVRGVHLTNGRLELFQDNGSGSSEATLSGQVNYVFIDPQKRIALVHESNTNTETEKGIESSRTLFFYTLTDSTFVRETAREFSLNSRETGDLYYKLYPEDDPSACSAFYLTAYRKVRK